MPLLKREPDLFPEGLFDLPVKSHPWWVAHVKSRQEKALARHLQPLGIPYYLPQREQKIRRAGRKFVSYLPLVSHPYIEPGSAVSITDGPFRGYEGIVLRAKGQLRIVVSINMLRTSFTVELDREVLALLVARVERFGRVSRRAA